MKRIDLLSLLAFLVVVGTQAWVRYGKTLPGKPEIYWIAAAILVAANLVLRWEDLSRSVGARQLRHGSNVVVLILAVLAGLVGVNYIAAHRTKRWDFTKSQRYSLSEETKRTLENLKDDITVVYFQDKAALGAGTDRMKRFETASSHFKVEYVDPLPNPARVTAYDVRPPWPVLVLERGAQRETIRSDSEQDLANALVKVTRDEKKTVCFAGGEGERDIEDALATGYSAAKETLEKRQYGVQKITLIREPAVPATCTVLVVPGPEKDLEPPVVDAIRKFVKGGGKALLMIEAETKGAAPNFTALLKEWNVEAGPNFIVDETGWNLRTGPLAPVAARDFGGYLPHPINRNLRSLIVFPLARSLRAGSTPVDGVSVETIVQTSEVAWIENGLKIGERKALDRNELVFDPVDVPGPHALAVAVTLKGPEPAPPPAGEDEKKADEKKPEGRVVVVGDADFGSNAVFEMNTDNQDFFLNSVAWLAEDADLISIRQREPDDQKLFLDETQMRTILLVAFILLPGLFVLGGVAAWWFRRG